MTWRKSPRAKSGCYPCLPTRYTTPRGTGHSGRQVPESPAEDAFARQPSGGVVEGVAPGVPALGATCRQQNRNILELTACCLARLDGSHARSLLPTEAELAAA